MVDYNAVEVVSMYLPRLRSLREDHDLTQAQVGAAIHVSQRTYAYYESGERMIPPSVLCALADFYQVSVDYLLGRTKEKDYPGADRNRKLGSTKRTANERKK